MNSSILAPAALLVLWSLIMLFWLAATRLPAASKLPKDKLKGLPRVGGRGQDLDPLLPNTAAWKSHNYTHLMEQPTLFYAIVAILAIAGHGSGLNTTLAWTYVGLRIAHSLWQTLVNSVPIRFLLFCLSTLCLLIMTINALRATL